MLSILIPVFNYDVSDLVKELYEQSMAENIEFEIIIADDFSEIKYEENKKLNDLSNIKYIELQENYGRSKIRNYLANIAKYENLIFLDCDSIPVNRKFIHNYLDFTNHNVVCGGTQYSKQKPENQDFLLHWLYGSNREVISATNRNVKPNKSFKTNNFFIKKYIFNIIRFNEQIKGYGHEDTFFGFELKQNNIKIYHIENPVYHYGIENNNVFLSKTEKGIKNLFFLYNQFNEQKEAFEDIKLLKYFLKIKKFYFCGFFKLIYKLFDKLIIKNLKSKNPCLFLFDLYKLSFLCSLN